MCYILLIQKYTKRLTLTFDFEIVLHDDVDFTHENCTQFYLKFFEIKETQFSIHKNDLGYVFSTPTRGQTIQ